MKKVVFTTRAPQPIGPYSQAIRVSNFIFGSGQIAIDPRTGELIDGGIKEQTRRVLENIRAVLEAEGFTLEDVVMTTVFLRNLKDFPDFNEEYAKFFPKDPPARTTVEVSNLPKGALLEVNFIAFKHV